MQSVQRFIFGPTVRCTGATAMCELDRLRRASLSGATWTLSHAQPQERVKEWQAQLRKEKRGLEREIRQMDDGQRKAKAQLKQLANKGETKNARILAREFVRSKKASQRLHSSVAQLNSINMQLSHQLGALAVCSFLCVGLLLSTLGNPPRPGTDIAQRHSRSLGILRSRRRS